MENFLLTLLLFILPFLVGEMALPQRGLHLGLWISLYSLGNLAPVISIIVFFAAVIVSLAKGKKGRTEIRIPYVQKASTPAFLLFLISLVTFCALCESCIAYGEVLNLSPKVLGYASACSFFGFTVGPVIFGRISDQKGPFAATIQLTLLAMASIGFSVIGQETPAFFPLSILVLYGTISGSFVLIPLMVMTYLGKGQLRYTYPLILFTLTTAWGTARYVFVEHWQQAKNPESYLIFMIFLSLFAALFVWTAWKNRFTLVPRPTALNK